MFFRIEIASGHSYPDTMDNSEKEKTEYYFDYNQRTLFPYTTSSSKERVYQNYTSTNQKRIQYPALFSQK